jgi:hypothetical protein
MSRVFRVHSVKPLSVQNWTLSVISAVRKALVLRPVSCTSCKSLGRENVTPARLAHLRRTVPAPERARLARDLDLAPAWMRPMLRDLAKDASGSGPLRRRVGR